MSNCWPVKQRCIFEEITSALKNTYLNSADNVSIVIEKLEELFQAAEAALAASQHKPVTSWNSTLETDGFLDVSAFHGILFS